MNILTALSVNMCLAANTAAMKVMLTADGSAYAGTEQSMLSQILIKIVIALVIGILGGLIYALMLKGELTSVYKNDTAADYKKPGSFKVELSRELFMYSKTERREKPQQNAPQSGKQ